MSMHRTITGIGLVGLGVAAAAAPDAASAQAVPYSLGTTAQIQSYGLSSPSAVGIEGLSLGTLSFGAGVRPVEPLRVELSGAYARGSLTRANGSTASIAGLTDTQIRAAYTMPDDRISVGLAYVLPTGQTRQSVEEIAVAGAIGSDFFPFAVSNWGAGGGFAMSGAFAAAMGDVGVALRLGYTIRRELTPIEGDEWRYEPGNELRAQLALDRSFGTATKATILLDAQRYGDDAIAGDRAYRSGSRIQATGSVSFAAGWRASGVAYLGVLRRSAGRFDTGSFEVETLDSPAMDLIMVGTGLRLPFSRGVVVPSADLRLSRRSDGVGQGILASLGTAVELPTGGFTLVPTLRGHFGRLVMWEGRDSAVWGVDIGLAVRGDIGPW